MGESRWQSVRIIAIALTLCGVVGVLVKAILFPNPPRDRLNYSFDFPATVAIAQWQLINTEPLKTTDQDHLNPGQQYQYIRQGDRVKIEVRYEHYTDGNVNRLLNIYTPIKPATVWLTVKHREDIGYYGLFTYQDQAYLSACINPSGQSTVTEQQFVQNKYSYSWSPQRTLLWVIGQNDLFDGRCFWTLLSTNVTSNSDTTSLEKAYQNLEEVWFDWYRWWKLKT